MDAKNFVKELKKMCDYYEEECRQCPLYGINDSNWRWGCEPSYMTEGIVDVVEQWRKEHPIITNRMKFEEVFGYKIPQSVEELLGWWWDEPYEEK